MRITTETDPSLEEVEVIIRCASRTDQEARRIYAALESADAKLWGIREGERCRLPAQTVLYIESVDRRTFLYTAEDSYETEKKLYELEAFLTGSTFFRVSKPMLVNLNRVRSVRPEVGGRLLLTMENGERIVVSRQFAPSIKSALEVL